MPFSVFETEWFFLAMKTSKDVYVRYKSQQEHLWNPNTKSSPRVM